VGKGMPKALASTSCEPALHSPVREVVDRGQELGEEPRIPVREAVDVAAQPDVARVHRGRRERGDRLVAVRVAAAPTPPARDIG
jgi:hypothetical protein